MSKWEITRESRRRSNKNETVTNTPLLQFFLALVLLSCYANSIFTSPIPRGRSLSFTTQLSGSSRSLLLHAEMSMIIIFHLIFGYSEGMTLFQVSDVIDVAALEMNELLQWIIEFNE